MQARLAAVHSVLLCHGNVPRAMQLPADKIRYAVLSIEWQHLQKTCHLQEIRLAEQMDGTRHVA